MAVNVEGTVVRKARRIPTKGEVFVKVGDLVEPETVLARGTVRNPEVHEIRVYSKLGVDPDQVKRYMLKEEGEEVKRDEVIAIYRAFFGRFTRTCRSPIDGQLETLLKSGVALIRGMPIPVEARAHIPGRVVELIPGEGAVVETRAALVNGVFGVGGETIGELIIAVGEPDEALTAEAITNAHKGKVVVGGSLVTLDALRKAANVGLSGVLIGGVDQKDLTDFLGHEIGVGVTGREEAGPTVIVTEGFGVYPMDGVTFNLLKSHEGKRASIDGTTQIRQRMLRPEIIIPL
ncbi:MAG: hypothetical protein OEW93_06265 [Candidatus Bathyarchaeota archaeon]|nr:hypothetical protein [Candidatus Bathyarchaeota archaeon]